MEQETPELADKLEQYQLKAKDALASAFFNESIIPASAVDKAPDVSPSGLAHLIDTCSKAILNDGGNAHDVRMMARQIFEARINMNRLPCLLCLLLQRLGRRRRREGQGCNQRSDSVKKLLFWGLTF